jgi:hypothetical protein
MLAENLGIFPKVQLARKYAHIYATDNLALLLHHVSCRQAASCLSSFFASLQFSSNLYNTFVNEI